jgi:hypothetical protein
MSEEFIGESPEAESRVAADMLAIPRGAHARAVLPHTTASSRAEKVTAQLGCPAKDVRRVSIHHVEDSAGTSPARRDCYPSRNTPFEFLAAFGNRSVRIGDNPACQKIGKPRLKGAAFRNRMKIRRIWRTSRRGKHGTVLACGFGFRRNGSAGDGAEP